MRSRTTAFILALLLCTACSGGQTHVQGAASVRASGAGEGASPAARVGAEATAAGEATRTPKSLVLALDGLRPDALAYAATPRIDALIAGTWLPGYQGAYSPVAQNLTDANTISGPNHVAIMTGATGAQHGVQRNWDVFRGYHTDYPHYLKRIERATPERHTAYLFTWKNDAKIPSDADYIFDGEDADNVARAAAILSGDHADEAGLNRTRWERGADVDALFLFLDNPDFAGHAEGFEPAIPAYHQAITRVDAQVGVLLDAIAARPTLERERWQIVLTSDHGGYHTHHGGNIAVTHTIPFLVVSPDVRQGVLPAVVRNVDVVPTVLTHMGIPFPPTLTGAPRGSVVDAAPTVPLSKDLAAYYRFDGDLKDSAGGGHDARVGETSDVAPALTSAGGKFGGYVSIQDPGGGKAGACFLTLGKPAALEMAEGQAFTVSVWFRAHGLQGGDPVILGNKDWTSGANPGWLLLANTGREHAFGANLADGDEARIDLGYVDYRDTDWWFLALTVAPQGVATMFAGGPDGVLRWMALEATGLMTLASPHPIHVGQDGTGAYGHNLDGDLDDLAIWRRALSMAEVQALYQRGQGAPVLPQPREAL
ncbi:MAG: alkaline phosphatase family protein [Myxococcota bacterium]